MSDFVPREPSSPGRGTRRQGAREPDVTMLPFGWDGSKPTVGRVGGERSTATYFPPAQSGLRPEGQPGRRPGAKRAPAQAPGQGDFGAPAPTRVVGAQRPGSAVAPVRPGSRARYGPTSPRTRSVVVRDVHHRRVVRRVDLVSVGKVSFLFYVSILLVVLVAGAVLWNVASLTGVMSSLDKLVRSLFALTSFQLHPLTVFGWAAAIGIVLCLLGVLLSVIAAALFNLISDIVGGIQVVVVSDDDV